MSTRRYGSGHTLAEAREILRELGISLRKTEHGEYRVAPNRHAHPELSVQRVEAIAAYETDIEAAIGTGKHMATDLKAKTR